VISLQILHCKYQRLPKFATSLPARYNPKGFNHHG
jgi:hypothetical protein